MLRFSICALGLAAFMTAASPAAAEETLRLRMNGDVNVLDPIFTTNFTIRNAAYLMFDTLFAMDENYEVQPQMAEGAEVSEDGMVYTIALRDGLKFHDGSPVTAADAVASIKRWGTVDGLGKILFSKMEGIEAKDEKTLVITLKERWGLVLDALGKISSNVPVIMPAEQAATPASEAVKTPIGSGPYKLVPEEWVPGSLLVFEKFGDYVPRKEPASLAAGGKVAHFDRVEIQYIPDTATAINALIAGEIDWMEEVPADMLMFFDGVDSAKTVAVKQAGNSMQLVVNHLNPPFDNPKIRRALQLALEQKPFLQASFGDATDRYLECASVFFCDTKYASDVNTDRVLKRDLKGAKKLLDEAGYDGTPVLLLHVTDIQSQDVQYSVLKPMMEQAGFVVNDQASDWATVSTRRASKQPVDKGGWNLFFTGWGFVDQSNPMTNVYVSGACENAWFGWPCSDRLQELREEFALAETEEKRKELAVEMQKITHDLVPFIPLGQAFPSIGIASNLEGYIKGPVPFFWNLRRID